MKCTTIFYGFCNSIATNWIRYKMEELIKVNMNDCSGELTEKAVEKIESLTTKLIEGHSLPAHRNQIRFLT